MRLLLVSVLPILLVLVGCQKDQPQSRDITQYTIEDFLATTSYSGSSFSPDNTKILVSSDASGVFNAYAVPVAGGDPVQLTHSTTNALFARSYFPGDDRFIYESDQAGNELDHVYVRELNGSVTDLTPGDSLKASFLAWAGDDRSFFISTNERDRRFFDIFEITVEGYSRTLVYQDDTGYEFAAISPDKRYLAFSKPRTTNDSDIYVYDRPTGKMIHTTPHEGDMQNTPQRFTPDSKKLLYTTDRDHEFQYLVSHDVETGEVLALDKLDWDVWYARFSKKGKYLVVGANVDARTEVRLYDTRTMERLPLPEFPTGDITSVQFPRDESLMAMYVSSSRIPRDLYVYDFSENPPRKLTHSLSPNIDPQDLVEAEVVRFPSYDGVEIPGILYRPHQASRTEKSPAVVWVHGGPGGQARVGYSSMMQYLANHGYVVFDINNRGSSGYGKTFYKMDDRRHGDADLDDCVESKKMLVQTGYVDPDRVAIAGGSYGGYMVLAALTFRPEAFAAGVDIFGISNWVRTLESIPPWWESIREALYAEIGNPEEDRDYLHRISPLFHAENIVRPLLVLQGANDPRVIQVESDDIVEKARANGVPVEYIVFEDEGHGFLKKENRIEGYRAVREFLDKHLKPAQEEKPPA